MTIGEAISELYRSRTEADFEHMRSLVDAMNASLQPGEEIPEKDRRGYMHAVLLLQLRAMEAAEEEVRREEQLAQGRLFA